MKRSGDESPFGAAAVGWRFDQRACSSATTQRRHEAYFRREWSYAVDRARNMADGAVFILPVCIDDTPEMQALVPDLFKAVHMSRLSGGEPTPEFVRRLQELSRGSRS